MILAVDTETTGLDVFHGCRPFMVTMCNGSDNYLFEGKVNPFTRDVYWEEDDLESIQSLLDQAETLVFHNTNFDLRMLESIGIRIDHLWDKIEDTLLAAHAVCSGDKHGLKYIAKKYLHYSDEDEIELDESVKEARRKARTLGYDIAQNGHRHFPGATKITKWHKQDMWLAIDECRKYALGDVERTWLLWEAFKVAMIGDGLIKAYRTRKKLLPITYRMQTVGIRLDIDTTNIYLKNTARKMVLIEKYIRKEMGIIFKFNWNKASHLIMLLHNHLKIPIKHFTPGGGASTNKVAVEHYTQQYPSKLLRAVSIARRMETEHRYIESYTSWIDEHNRIHSSVNITGTRETRQSSSSPNIQNVKRGLKRLFGPPPGKVWIEIDFANIELRLWAYSVENEDLIAAFEQGISVHKLIMQAIYPKQAAEYEENPDDLRLQTLYTRVKGGTFSRIYGATEKKSDETYGYPGATQKVNARFPGVQEFSNKIAAQCEKNFHDYGAHAIFTLGAIV